MRIRSIYSRDVNVEKRQAGGHIHLLIVAAIAAHCRPGAAKHLSDLVVPMPNFETLLFADAAITEQTLAALIPTAQGPRARVLDAMRYSALDGGKRFRPFLVMRSAALFGVSPSQSARVGAALEMIHCYSLIHDDLPAMDNADLRRGRPSLHKAFDEATAILAGDALLTLAFEVVAEEATHADASTRTRLVIELARSAGHAGMVGGQMIDLSPIRNTLSLDGVAELQALKTGALIGFGVKAGAMLGGADRQQIDALDHYAQDLGLAFQIADDILDATSTSEQLGKPAQQDADKDKATFVKLLGLSGAQAEAQKISERAIEALASWGVEADPLRGAARYVISRSN